MSLTPVPSGRAWASAMPPGTPAPGRGERGSTCRGFRSPSGWPWRRPRPSPAVDRPPRARRAHQVGVGARGGARAEVSQARAATTAASRPAVIREPGGSDRHRPCSCRYARLRRVHYATALKATGRGIRKVNATPPSGQLAAETLRRGESRRCGGRTARSWPATPPRPVAAGSNARRAASRRTTAVQVSAISNSTALQPKRRRSRSAHPPAGMAAAASRHEIFAPLGGATPGRPETILIGRERRSRTSIAWAVSREGECRRTISSTNGRRGKAPQCRRLG